MNDDVIRAGQLPSKPTVSAPKTTFILITSRQQARNVLRTDIFSTLAKQPRLRLIVFVPAFKIKEYKREYGGDNIIWEGIKEPERFFSSLDAFFGRIGLFYINSPTVRFLRKEWLWYEKCSPLRYGISMILLFLLSNKIMRTLGRTLDYYLVRDDRYAAFFEHYTPDLVFLPRIDTALAGAFLRHAKKRRVATVGMIGSWDNITYSKYPYRILPDSLIVHNEIIRKEAIHYLGMSESNIVVTGIPHFDHYVTDKRSSRESFCKKLGINPEKRIILFGSIGRDNPTEWQVLLLLDRAIVEGKLPQDVVIVFRMHPTEKIEIDTARYSKNIVFDDSKTFIRGAEVYSEILKDDMRHLADSIYHAEVTLNSCSTMSIDAAALDKPIINFAYDGWEQLPFHQSIRKAYTPARFHNQAVVKSKGTRIAYSHDEMITYIMEYLACPARDRQGRRRIVQEQCFKLDGTAGKRVADHLLSHLFDAETY